MILNNKNLPYNLRISGNEAILEFKPDGATFNLHKLTPDDAVALANRLTAWSEPQPARVINANTELSELQASHSRAIDHLNIVHDWLTERGVASTDNGKLLSVPERLATIKDDAGDEPNSPEIPSPTVEEEFPSD